MRKFYVLHSLRKYLHREKSHSLLVKVLSHIRYTPGCVRLEKVLRTAQLEEVLTQGEKSQSTSERIVLYQIHPRLCKT